MYKRRQTLSWCTQLNQCINVPPESSPKHLQLRVPLSASSVAPYAAEIQCLMYHLPLRPIITVRTLTCSCRRRAEYSLHDISLTMDKRSCQPI